MAEKYDSVVVRGNYGSKHRETDGVKTQIVTQKKASPDTRHIGKLLSEPMRPDLRGEDPETKKKRTKKSMDDWAKKSREIATYRGAGWRSTPGGLAM